MVNGGDDEKQEINNHVKKSTNYNKHKSYRNRRAEILENRGKLMSQFKLKIFL
jgi:hypothetical protein